MLILYIDGKGTIECKKGLNLLTKRAQYKKANLVVGAGGGEGITVCGW